jgi:NADH-quinone oxidoreductase chain G
MPKLTIDGKEIEVPEGTTILEAALGAGIALPNFCYHPKLETLGACRVCVVEVEGQRKLQTACTEKVADGMVVHTRSEAAVRSREGVIEFLLTNHPLDCPMCDRGGWCDLQDFAFFHGTGVGKFMEPKRRAPDLDLGRFIILNHNRCILCYRCVRYYAEVVGEQELGVSGRGAQSQIISFRNRHLSTGMSGNLVDVCPLGALTDRVFRFRARIWEMAPKLSVCPFCSVGCNLALWTKRGEVLQSRPLRNDAVNETWICDRGRFGLGILNSRARLRRPLLRQDGKLVETGWEEALSVAARRLREVASQHGAQAVGGLASGRCTDEELYLFQKLVRAALGSPNVDHTASTVRPTRPLREAFGFEAATVSLAGLEKASCFLVFGCDLNREIPVAAVRVRKAASNGAKVIAAGARRPTLKMPVEQWLVCRPGSELALCMGLLEALVEQGLAKPDAAEGFEEMAASMKGFGLSRAEELTGVAAEDMRAAARTFASAKDAVAIFGSGATGSVQAEACVSALADLCLACGHFGREQAGIMPALPENNWQGALDMGAAPDLLPGQREVSDEDAALELSQMWGADVPRQEGLHGWGMLEAAARGEIKALVCLGSNPAAASPDPEMAGEALKKLEFLLTIELFPTETAELSHVVLPGAGFAEKDGTYTNAERRVQLVRAAVPAPGEAKAEWEILRLLAWAMGKRWEYSSASQVMEEAAKAAPTYAGMSFERLAEKGMRWPHGLADGEGLAGGRARFIAIGEKPIAPAREEVGLWVMTGVELFDTDQLAGEKGRFLEVKGNGFVELSSEDAEGLGVGEGDSVRVSANGFAVEAAARITRECPPGVIFMPSNVRGGAVRKLLARASDGGRLGPRVELERI